MSYLRVRLDSVTQGCHAITQEQPRASHSRRGTQVRDSRQEGYKTAPSKLGQSVASTLLYAVLTDIREDKDDRCAHAHGRRSTEDLRGPAGKP